jgi:hypothetical protein
MQKANGELCQYLPSLCGCTAQLEYQTVFIDLLVWGKIDKIYYGLLRFLVFWLTEAYRRRPSILPGYFVKALQVLGVIY